jgi:TRAP-type C4-dicarboxylate transport system permease small subunit
MSNLGQGVLMVMVLLVVTDIVLRRLFNSPLTWSLEAVEVMLVIVVFFSVAYCAVKDSHVSIDVLVARLPAMTRRIIDVFTHLLGIALFGFMTWGAIMSGITQWKGGYITGILPVPVYPFLFIIAFGSAMLALVLLTRLLELIFGMVKP